MKDKTQQPIRYSLKRYLRKLSHFLTDILNRLENPHSMLPPRSMMMVNPHNFVQVGQELKDYFVGLANLQPSHRVLDVGCGAGRLAIPLTTYLSEDGEYWGFDIRKNVIKWCQDHISSKYSNFHFLHSNVYNKLYNPKGKVQAHDFVFPFVDASFDFVFLISVFTHMHIKDMENYLGEISRVIKPGGACFITYFLRTHGENESLHFGSANLYFTYDGHNYFSTKENNPEKAIAYDEEYIHNLYRLNGFKLIRLIRHGSWSKSQDYLGKQDIVIATKDISN